MPLKRALSLFPLLHTHTISGAFVAVAQLSTAHHATYNYPRGCLLREYTRLVFLSQFRHIIGLWGLRRLPLACMVSLLPPGHKPRASGRRVTPDSDIT